MTEDLMEGFYFIEAAQKGCDILLNSASYIELTNPLDVKRIEEFNISLCALMELCLEASREAKIIESWT